MKETAEGLLVFQIHDSHKTCREDPKKNRFYSACMGSFQGCEMASPKEFSKEKIYEDFKAQRSLIKSFYVLCYIAKLALKIKYSFQYLIIY